jgi:hypothetical protein
MQMAKDTFFVALRDRLAALDADRTVVVRGAVRPAVLVAENELPEASGDPLNAFVLRWGAETVDATEPLPLHALQCEVRYKTAGSAEGAGMDRGRVLEAMDGALRQMLMPGYAAKMDYSQTPVVEKATAVFWSMPEFAAVVAKDDCLSRAVTLQVFALQEAA